MSSLVAVDTEFVSSGNFPLFAFDGGKCSFISRMISFLCVIKLFVSRFVTVVIISVAVFIV